jgi:hypothetical protein
MNMKKATPPRNRTSLVENAGLLKTIAVMIVCHAMVSVLCITVMFDISFFGIPLFLSQRIGIISDELYYRLTSAVINWTTPIVFGFPMVYSGTRVYSNNMDIIFESKSRDSLLLANHGSRIDWMVAMFIGHLKGVGNRVGERCRVGFVCEALIQFMPLIGWYRKLICDDIFVWRSIDKDAPTIKGSIKKFHEGSQKRMLFLSPEGVVVDHGVKDMQYVHQCQNFAKSNDFKPFEYVLTPRYKGTSCLLDQVSSGGPLVSICLAFVRDGKLMNCKLVSSDRVVPDIYHLCQGIAGSPISIFMHLRKIKVDANVPFDAKTVLMAEYEWKDSVLAEWDERLANNDKRWKTEFTEIPGCKQDVLLNHFAHAIVMMGTAIAFGYHTLFMKMFFGVFCCVASTHTFGWMVNETSMESVPFETGIKAMITFFSNIHGASVRKK